MILWRIARTPFTDLSGEGARLFGGRWNSPGISVVYFSDHPALALLEILANLDLPFDLMPQDFELMTFVIPDDVYVTTISHASTGAFNFRSAGDNWAKSNESVLLQVASVLMPEANNYLFNPAHAESEKAILDSKRRLEIDERLIRTWT